MQNKILYNLFTVLLPIVLGIFLYTIGKDWLSVNPFNLNWLYSGFDAKTSQIGWQFFLKDVWHFPVLGLNPNYGYATNTIVYSDSIPILSLIFKLLFFKFDLNIQYFGIALLIQFILHSYFSILIAKRFSNNIVIIILFALLCSLSPMVYNRGSENTALSMHWLIVCAIYLYIANFSVFNYRWSLLTVISLGIHFYLFFIIQLLRFAFCINNLFFYISKPIKFLLDITLSILVILLFAKIYGYFEINTNFDSLTWGRGSGNLASFFHPFDSGWSIVFLRYPWSNNQYHGFAYLGIGLLAALIVSIIILFLDIINAYKLIIKNWALICLIPLVMAASLGNNVYFFDILIYTWYPKINSISGIERIIVNILSLTRDCGRLLWLIWYLVVIFSLIILIKFKTNSISKILLLSIFLFIQFKEFRDGVSVANAFNLSSYKRLFIFDSSTNELENEINSIKFPKNINRMINIQFGNLAPNWDVLSRIALNNNISINVGYWARFDTEFESKSNNQLLTIFKTHDFERNIVYVTDEKYQLPLSIYSKMKIIKTKNNTFFWISD